MSSKQHVFRLLCLYCKGDGVEFTDSSKLKDHLIQCHPEYVSHLEFKSPPISTQENKSSSSTRNGREISPFAKQSSSSHQFSPKTTGVNTASSSALSNLSFESSNDKRYSPKSQLQLSLDSKTGIPMLDYNLPPSNKIYKSEKELSADEKKLSLGQLSDNHNDIVFKNSEMLRQKFKKFHNDIYKPRESVTKLAPLVPDEDKEYVLKADSISHSSNCSRENLLNGMENSTSLDKACHNSEGNEQRQNSRENIHSDLKDINASGEISLDLTSSSTFRRRSFTDEERLNLGLSPVKKSQVLESLEEILGIETSIPTNKNYSLQSQLLNEATPEREKVLALEDLLQNETRETNSLKQQLLDEKRKNDVLTKEMKTLQAQGSNRNESTDIKIADLTQLVHASDQKIEELNEKVKNLESDKQKLISRLKEADASFKSLSRRASLSETKEEVGVETTSSPNKYTMDYVMKYMGKQLQMNLDQITNTVQQISTKELSSRKELFELKDELHRVTLLLSEEKLKHDEVRKINNELEETLIVMSEFEEQKAKVCDDLTQLRKEHKNCLLTEAALKQTKREKKSLFRKHENLKNKFEILRVLHETLKDELVAKEVKCKAELPGDVLNNSRDSDKNIELIADLRHKLSEKEKELEWKDVAHTQTLEELKTSRLELKKLNIDKLKENPSLENLNRSINDVRNCLTDIKSEKSQKFEDVERLNARLRADVAHLGERLSEKEEELESLRGKITQMDITKLENESEIGKLTEELERARLLKKSVDEKTVSEKTSQVIENLQLEKDILSSRVLILEGIGDDIEILKQERDKLKEVNEELREKLYGKFKVKGCYSEGDVSHFGPIKMRASKKGKRKSKRKKELIKDEDDDDIFDTIRSISGLDENDKHRLQDMLSHPMFENFLAKSPSGMFDLGDLKIDQPSDTSVQHQNDGIEGEEHVFNRESFSPTLAGSPEYVQQIYIQESESDHQLNPMAESESEDTVDYSKSVGEAKKHKNMENEDEYEDVEPEIDRSLSRKDSLKRFEKLRKKNKFVGSKKNGRRLKRTSKKNLNIRASSDDLFQKIHDLSSKEELHSPSSERKVNSMKKVEFTDDQAADSYAKEQDDKLFRSYLKECLADKYPVLADDSEESIEKELDYVSSFTSESVSPLGIERDSPILKAEKILSEDVYKWSDERSEKDCFVSHDRYQGAYDHLIDQGYNSTSSSTCGLTVNKPSSQFNISKNRKLFDNYRNACMEFSEKKRVATDALKALKSVMSDADIGDLESCLQNSEAETS